jgi:predicted unusual protein kinase regulating ubiquinone biosynthesis (AarF/ABC1/UbiB family)
MFIKQVGTFLSNIYFLFEVSWIIISTYLYFLYNKDYVLFIKNITHRLSNKNILYVKFFQAISLNNNLIDETINQQLIKYTDSVPYNTDDIDWELLVNLKKTFGIELLTTNKPINSGMISLVYKMNDTIHKKQIIVKTKRRGIEKKLNNAIEKIKFIIQILVCIPSLNKFNIWDSFNKNIDILKSQLDFEQEVKNTIRMKKECKNLKYVKVPLVYEAVTQLYKNVIVMEYIQGQHISKVDETDYEQFAKLVVKYGLVSSFVNGFGHGDLHAGNILFIKNSGIDNNEYKLGLIDFGIVLEIDENIRYKFLDIFSDFHTKKSIDISKDLLSCFVEPKKVFEELPLEHKTSITNIISDIIENIIHNSKSINQSKIFEFIVNFNNYLNANDLKKYGLYFNDDFIKMQMGISMAQGVCLSLCKGNYVEIANQVYNEMFHNDIFSEEELLL